MHNRKQGYQEEKTAGQESERGGKKWMITKLEIVLKMLGQRNCLSIVNKLLIWKSVESTGGGVGRVEKVREERNLCR